MAEGSNDERIGLLFVHGIGEQPRWDHLKSSVQEFAELLLQSKPGASVNVVDRTDEWPHPAGQPDPGGLAPVTLTLTLKKSDRRVEYHCHEVWWADLGARSGVGDVVAFWLWGLGQWAAPIYCELDASRLPKEKLAHLTKPVSTMVALPASVAGNVATEPLSRLQLALAAVAALFVAVTWTLAKRLFAALLGQAPSATLIVRYVGDVRTYEERAAPGDSSLTDPAKPRRVGIRRRMVREMIALATADLDGWYVLSHSLGTVVAYNGLTETGHALPNYLTEEQWQHVPAELKRVSGCRLRNDVAGMMPARPPWLQHEDVINRKRLFAGLRGFLTYGSPLDKFAGLWPRIVATATDRTDGTCPFPIECRWLNLAAPSDPVGGDLDSYGTAAGARLENAIPTFENFRTPWNIRYGLAHIEYFKGAEPFSTAGAAKQKRALATWLLDPAAEIPDHRNGRLMRLLTEQLAYPLLVAVLWLITTAVAVALVQGLGSLFSHGGIGLGRFACAWWGALRDVLAIALGVVLVMGRLRWRRDARLNVRLVEVDQAADDDQTDERARYWRRIFWMQRLQAAAASAYLLAAIAGLLIAISWDWGAPTNWLRLISTEWQTVEAGGGNGGWWTLGMIALLLLAGAVTQTLLNLIVPPVGKAPG